MKKAPYLILIAIMFAACGPTHVVVQNDAPPPPPPMEAPEVSYQSFYDELSPYGQWIDYPGYGYVWMPNVSYGFRPYSTNGHWVATDMGWTWASDYPWGWAAFHYGRWFFDNGYGWMWIPGQEWAPAWVSWRSSQDYYGWAPLGPNIGFSTGYYNPPANYWCFVPHQYVSNPHMNNYYVNESRNVTIINNTTIINNYNTSPNVRNSYRGGPAADEVARYSGAPVRPVVVRENNRPGEQLNNNQFNIYRPRVSTTPAQNTNGNRPAPARVQSLREVRPTRQSGEAAAEPVNNQPVNRNNTTVPNNTTTPAPSYNNNNNPNNNRPAVEPARTTRPENNNVNTNRPTDTRPDNDNRSRNMQGQPATNVRPVNPAPAPTPHNNATFNRPAPSNPNAPRPTTNSNSQQRTANTPAQNTNKPTVTRPSSTHPAPQKTTTPATNQTQKPQTKPTEKPARPEEQK